jgi:hypothetical protein
VGLGTTSPGAKFHVVGTQGSIGAGTFQLNTSTLFSDWSGTYPAFELVNTDTTNNNVSLFQFADAPSGASHAGIGAVSTNHTNKFGDMFFYTKQADGYQIRMGIYSGNVGIGTTTPGVLLDVAGTTTPLHNTTSAALERSALTATSTINPTATPSVGPSRDTHLLRATCLIHFSGG